MLDLVDNEEDSEQQQDFAFRNHIPSNSSSNSSATNDVFKDPHGFFNNPLRKSKLMWSESKIQITLYDPTNPKAIIHSIFVAIGNIAR